MSDRAKETEAMSERSPREELLFHARRLSVLRSEDHDERRALRALEVLTTSDQDDWDRDWLTLWTKALSILRGKR